MEFCCLLPHHSVAYIFPSISLLLSIFSLIFHSPTSSFHITLSSTSLLQILPETKKENLYITLACLSTSTSTSTSTNYSTFA